MPVSRTAKRSPTLPLVAAADTDTTTSPCSVNLIALPIRFMSTCRSRVGSPRTIRGTSGATSASNSRCFSRARTARRLAVACTTFEMSNGIDSSSRCSASIFE